MYICVHFQIQRAVFPFSYQSRLLNVFASIPIGTFTSIFFYISVTLNFVCCFHENYYDVL